MISFISLSILATNNDNFMTTLNEIKTILAGEFYHPNIKPMSGWLGISLEMLLSSV